MFAVRPLFVLLLLVSTLALVAGCQDGSTSDVVVESRSLGKDFQWLPMYGDGTNDASEVIAKVGSIEITARDLELYLDELPSTQQAHYAGPDGERLLLKRMVEYALLVQEAAERKLYNDPDVARTIISQRRNALQSAMVNYGLLRDVKPTEEEVREYFMNNREQYRQLGIVNARHIECRTKADAEKAYQRLTEGGKGNDWMSVMTQMTVNQESKELEGSTGWFNQGGIIPFILGSQKFTTKAYGLEIGLHPPFLIMDRWHVVEIMRRENERPMTFAEARNQVELDMLPAWQDGLVRDHLLKARKTHSVQMMGKFAPGQGLTVDELFAQANAVTDGERKIAPLNLIHTDYPESGRGDDALFMAAMTALETWQDVRVAERYLRLLLEEYPDSELREDAQFLKDNLYNPDALNPKSMEDLKK
jgi:hypothetical protein